MQQHQTYGGQSADQRSIGQAMWRGFLGKCPHCGSGKLFHRFLKVADNCEACGEDYHHHRADDLPAYLVVVIVGHLVLGGFMGTERMLGLSSWGHLAIWVPVTLIACLALLQPVKGAVVGLQWAARMHGFSGTPDVLETHPEG